MKNQRITYYLFFTAVVLVLSSFQFGYGLSELNSAEFFMPYFTDGNKYADTVIYTHENQNRTCNNMHKFFKDCIPMHSEADWNLCVSLYAIGGLIGAFLGGPLSSCFGRKWALWTTTFVYFLDYFLKSFFSNYWPLLIGRILHGVASGTATSIVPMFLTEITPRKFRGMFGTFHQVGVVVGMFSSQFVSIFVYRDGQYWRILMGWPALLTLVQFVFIPFYVPESPKYLVSKNKIEKARKVLKQLRGVKKKDMDGVEEELNVIIRECQVGDDTKAKEEEEGEEENKGGGGMGKEEEEDEFKFPCWRFMYHLFLACALQVIQQFSGTNAISFYSTKVFTVIFPDEGYLLPTILSAVVMLFTIFAVLPTTCLVEIVGRKWLLLGGTIMEIISMLGVTVFQVVMDYAFPGGGPWNTVFGVLTIISVIVFRIFFQWSLGPIPWFITSELFPTKVRGYGNAAAVATNWLFTFIVGQFFPPLQAAMNMFCFLLFTGFMVVAWVFMFFCLMETKGKTIEEVSNTTVIDHIFFCEKSSCCKDDDDDDDDEEEDDDDDEDEKKGLITTEKKKNGENGTIVYDLVQEDKKVVLEDHKEVEGKEKDYGEGEDEGEIVGSESVVNNVVDYNINLSEK